MKKGLSAIISVVLLIGFLMVLGFLYFSWTQNYTSTIFGGFSKEDYCRDVKFYVGEICHNLGQSRSIKFSATNQDNEAIFGFSIQITDGLGGLKTVSANPGLEGFESGEAVSDNFVISFEPKTIRVIPNLKEGGSSFMCEDKSQTFIWNEIDECS